MTRTRARCPRISPRGVSTRSQGDLLDHRTTRDTIAWVSAEGDLYTREGIDAAGRRYDVWSWSLDGAAMAPHDLGSVCLDLAVEPPRYGTC